LKSTPLPLVEEAAATEESATEAVLTPLEFPVQYAVSSATLAQPFTGSMKPTLDHRKEKVKKQKTSKQTQAPFMPADRKSVLVPHKELKGQEELRGQEVKASHGQQNN